MNTSKTVYCFAFDNNDAGGFDWYPEPAMADEAYQKGENMPVGMHLYRFDVEVPASICNDGNAITDFIDNDLRDYCDKASMHRVVTAKEASTPNSPSDGPWSEEATMSSDHRFIRYINDANGRAIAEVRYAQGAEQDENLANAALLAAANDLQKSLKECLGFVEAWQMHLSDSGNTKAAATVAQVLETARNAYAKSKPKSLRCKVEGAL